MVHPDRLAQSHFQHQNIAQNSSLLVGRNHELNKVRERLEAALRRSLRLSRPSCDVHLNWPPDAPAEIDPP